MAKDPYGNEIEDPFDKAIAQGVMRSTWSSAIVAMAFALSSGCCVPVSSVIAPTIVPLLVGAVSLCALAAGINVAIRVFTMQPEHKELVPSWHPWGALGLGALGAFLGVLQLLFVTITFLLASLAS
ncbi:MAG: hypothetical protein H6734_26860 [Alphaproteobacteria bacterium]|nr:hypothetical protein [Alphaproteobacteria bacterium]